MNEVKFEDVVEFLEGPGVRKWQFKEEGVKLINIRNLVNDKLKLDNTDKHLAINEVESKYKHFLLENGDFVMASSGVTWGKIAEVKEIHLPLCLNTSIIKLKPRNEKLSKRFLWHFIKGPIFRKQINRIITGSAQPNFGPSHLKKIFIPLPPLPTQKHIAHILDQADALKRHSRALIAKYEELTQSLFLEMFGDPVRNPMGWEVKRLEELGKITSGSTPSRKKEGYFNGKIPWVKTGEVKGEIIKKTEERISKEALENSSCKIYPVGSLIIAMYGQGKTRGQIGVLGIEATTNQACAVIPPSNKMDFIFLFNLLTLCYENLRSLGRGGNQPNLNTGLIKKYKVLSPPLHLQNQFAKRVQEIEAQKALTQQGLAKAETLFEALLQRAFKGDLATSATVSAEE